MSLNSSFSDHKRKIDIVDHKEKLRADDPRRRPASTGPDIGIGFFYGFGRFPSRPIAPGAPSTGTTR